MLRKRIAGDATHSNQQHCKYRLSPFHTDRFSEASYQLLSPNSVNTLRRWGYCDNIALGREGPLLAESGQIS